MDPLAPVGLDEQLAALADPKRLMILRLLMAHPTRQVDLGNAIGKHPAWVHHHLMHLVRVGLVEMIEERKVANYTEKWYQASAAAYAVHLLVTPDTGVDSPLVVLGSDDLALRELINEDTGSGATSFPIGSLDGLIALRQGLADMAGAHLLDVDGTYNSGYVRHLFPDRPMAMLTLAHREQGLVTAAGNPLSVSDISDLTRPDVRFAARNPGSGTSVWLEEKLREIGVDPIAVTGRASVTASTHSAAAEAVAHGTADATIAIRAVAEELGLHFTPLFHERYDLILAADRLDEPAIAHILELLSESGFKRAVGALPGYDASDTGSEQVVTFAGSRSVAPKPPAHRGVVPVRGEKASS